MDESFNVGILQGYKPAMTTLAIYFFIEYVCAQVHAHDVCTCEYICHSVGMEMRKQFCRFGSLCQNLHSFWDWNSGCPACMESTFTH